MSVVAGIAVACGLVIAIAVAALMAVACYVLIKHMLHDVRKLK